MKNAAALLLLLCAACASSTAVLDKRVIPCGPGRDIEIRAGLDSGALTREVGGRAQYLVEVANNSGGDVTVQSLRIDPTGENARGIPGAHEEFDQLISGGDAHVFEIPVSEIGPGPFVQMASGERIEFVVRVQLTNGDLYHCGFEGLWR